MSCFSVIIVNLIAPGGALNHYPSLQFQYPKEWNNYIPYINLIVDSFVCCHK